MIWLSVLLLGQTKHHGLYTSEPLSLHSQVVRLLPYKECQQYLQYRLQSGNDVPQHPQLPSFLQSHRAFRGVCQLSTMAR